MNAAICSRVTLSLGQNSVLSGGLQPAVTPASASHSMCTSKIESSSSVNLPPAANTAAGTRATKSKVASMMIIRRLFGLISFLSCNELDKTKVVRAVYPLN